MRVHMTTVAQMILSGRFMVELLPEQGAVSHLMSYAYKETERMWTPAWEACRPNVHIDSGAFTAWSIGKLITPEEYAEWALDFERRWRPRMNSLEFISLDVIGDQEGTWRNLDRLRSLGLNPLPVVTYGASMADIDRAMDQSDYMALGGLVPYVRRPPTLRSWLDACFCRVMLRRKATGIMPKLHLLGVTTDWVLKRYPCFSSDSSSWVQGLRFSGGVKQALKTANIKAAGMPRIRESEAGMYANSHTLKAQIKRFLKMEKEATDLWTFRGINWEERLCQE
jgi:hypothetical protein